MLNFFLKNKLFQILFFGISLIVLILSIIFFGVQWRSGTDVKQQCETIENYGARINCYSTEVDTLLEDNQTGKALDRVAVIFNEEPDFQSNCHAFMHTIGEKSYLQFDEGKTFTVSPNISICTFGFYHGFLDTLIQVTGDYSQARDFCDYTNTLLTESGINNEALVENCYHGIGHGTIDEHRPDTDTDPFSLTAKTLLLCKEVTATEKQLHDCATGVFNGVANYYLDGKLDWKIDAKDPVALCRVQSEQFKETCYAFMARVVLNIHNYDVMESLVQIEKIVERAYVKNVIQNLTLIATAQSGLNETAKEEYVKNCHALSDTDNQISCIEGLVIGVIQSGNPQLPYAEIVDMCFFESLTPDEQNGCLTHAYSNIQIWYTHAQVQTYCQRIEKEYRLACSTYENEANF